MTKELSYIDISRIYSYVEGMGVEFYDVQVEIVDHIASVMEEQMNMNPDKPFKEIFDATLSTFTDFDGLVNEKRRQVALQYNRYVFQSLKSFFSWPKIIFTLLLTWFIYFFLDKADNQLIKLVEIKILQIGLIIWIGYTFFAMGRINLEIHKFSTTNHTIWHFLLSGVAQFFPLLTKYTALYYHDYTLLFAITYCASFLLIWAVVESYEKLRAYGRDKYLKALA
jgi:hypothetical protein